MSNSHLDPTLVAEAGLNLNRQRTSPTKPTKPTKGERSSVADSVGGPPGDQNLGTASAADATASHPQRMTMLRATAIVEAASPRMTMQRRPA